eukprot:355081-Chlamydomonas_euryale.AAC.5
MGRFSRYPADQARGGRKAQLGGLCQPLGGAHTAVASSFDVPGCVLRCLLMTTRATYDDLLACLLQSCNA